MTSLFFIVLQNERSDGLPLGVRRLIFVGSGRDDLFTPNVLSAQKSADAALGNPSRIYVVHSVPRSTCRWCKSAVWVSSSASVHDMPGFISPGAARVRSSKCACITTSFQVPRVVVPRGVVALYCRRSIADQHQQMSADQLRATV